MVLFGDRPRPVDWGQAPDEWKAVKNKNAPEIGAGKVCWSEDARPSEKNASGFKIKTAPEVRMGKVCWSEDARPSEKNASGFKTKNRPEIRSGFVELPGFEPRITGPESVVLPLHHSSMIVCQTPFVLFDVAKVELYFSIAKKNQKKIYYFCFNLPGDKPNET